MSPASRVIMYIILVHRNQKRRTNLILVLSCQPLEYGIIDWLNKGDEVEDRRLQCNAQKDLGYSLEKSFI
jgi:hypothetical protein